MRGWFLRKERSRKLRQVGQMSLRLNEYLGNVRSVTMLSFRKCMDFYVPRWEVDGLSEVLVRCHKFLKCSKCAIHRFHAQTSDAETLCTGTYSSMLVKDHLDSLCFTLFVCFFGNLEDAGMPSSLSSEK